MPNFMNRLKWSEIFFLFAYFRNHSYLCNIKNRHHNGNTFNSYISLFYLLLQRRILLKDVFLLPYGNLVDHFQQSFHLMVSVVLGSNVVQHVHVLHKHGVKPVHGGSCFSVCGGYAAAIVWSTDFMPFLIGWWQVWTEKFHFNVM